MNKNRVLSFCRKRLNLGQVKAYDVALAVADALRVKPPSKSKKYTVMADFYEKYQGIDGIAKQIDETGIAPVKRIKKARWVPSAPSTNKLDVNSDAFLLSYEWRKLRMQVLKECGARCECCGASPKDGIVIHVDHIKPRRKYPELALTKANLQVLCEVCNHGKGSWDETDWRTDSQLSGRDGHPSTRSGDGYGQTPGARPRLVARTQEKARNA